MCLVLLIVTVTASQKTTVMNQHLTQVSWAEHHMNKLHCFKCLCTPHPQTNHDSSGSHRAAWTTLDHQESASCIRKKTHCIITVGVNLTKIKSTILSIFFIMKTYHFCHAIIHVMKSLTNHIQEFKESTVLKDEFQIICKFKTKKTPKRFKRVPLLALFISIEWQTLLLRFHFSSHNWFK